MNVQEGTRRQMLSLVLAKSRVFPAVIVLLGLSMTCGLANAQGPYKKIAVNPAYEIPENLKKMRDLAKRIASTRDANMQGQNYAKTFYEKYVPAKITNDPTQITELMNTLKANYSLASRSNAPATIKIVQWIYSGMKPIATGNFAPPARINAILMISLLDEKPVDKRNGTAPVPLRYIVTDLLPIYTETTNPDGVRAAALQGLRRYCIFNPKGVKSPNLETLKTAMTDLLNEPVPQGRSAAAHAFMQRYAVDILSQLKEATDPELGKQLVSISTETAKHDLIALHSAGRIGGMSADLKDNVDAPGEIMSSWTVRAMRAFQYEVIRLKSLDPPKFASQQPSPPETRVSRKTTKPKKNRGGDMDEMDSMRDSDMDEMNEMDGMGDMSEMMEGMFNGGMTRATVVAQPPEILTSRRKLNYVIQQLHLGATGTTDAEIPSKPGGLLAAVADKTEIEAWVNGMAEVLTGLNDPTIGQRAVYIKMLETQIEALEELAGDEAIKALAKAPPIAVAGVPAMVAVSAPEKVEAAPGAVGADPVLDKTGVPEFPTNLDDLPFE